MLYYGCLQPRELWFIALIMYYLHDSSKHLSVSPILRGSILHVCLIIYNAHVRA